MQEPRAARTQSNIVAWLGPPPQAELSASIGRLAELRMGPDRNATIWVVWSSPTIRALQILSRAPVPAIVVHPKKPAKETEKRFLDAGAREVVSLRALPVTLQRHLGAQLLHTEAETEHQPFDSVPMGTDSWLREPSLDSDPPADKLPTSFNPASLLGGGSVLKGLPTVDRTPNPDLPDDAPQDAAALKRALEPATELVSRSLEPPSAPVSDAPEDGWPPESMAAWILGLERYIQTRGRWLQRARAKLKHYLELCYLREQMPLAVGDRPRIDVFGQVKGQEIEPLRWPLLIRRTVGEGGAEVQVEQGKLLHVGTDGLTLEVGFQAGPKQKLLLDLNLSATENAQIMVEAAWQRRLGLRRFQVGAYILQMRRVKLDD